MNKSTQHIAIALIVSMAICSASPARLDKLKPSNSRRLARQEVAEDIPAQTPYPPAGIRPEIRFNLPTDEKLVAPDNTYLPPVGQPAQTYGPPAETYGPPEVGVKDEVEEVAEEQPEPKQIAQEDSNAEGGDSAEPSQNADEDQAQADDISEDDAAALEAKQIEEEIERVEAEEGLTNSIPARIVLLQGRGKNSPKLKSGRLQVQPALGRQSSAAQPIYLVNYNGQLYRILN